jgi:hypothetical protein
LTTPTIINKLALVAGAGAQAMANFRIKLVGDQLTAQLNKRIAQLKAQSTDSLIPSWQSRINALRAQDSGYSSARTSLSQNGTTLADLTFQLGNLAAAAQSGNAAVFDQTLRAATTDVDHLALVPYQPGFQSDGVLSLKTKGLGIQSSATYDLSTPAGQAQAAADVQVAQGVAQNTFTQTTQNQAIANSASRALQGQISALSNQISQRQFNQLSISATEIAKLKQQSQQQFHLIELEFGTVGQSASILASTQTSTAPAPGSIISLLVGQRTPTLSIANVTPVAAPVTVKSRGTAVSTTA